MLILGIWLTWLGYALLYTGAAKVSGDTSCTIGKAIRSGCSWNATGGQGGYRSQGAYNPRMRRAWLALDGQQSIIGAPVT